MIAVIFKKRLLTNKQLKFDGSSPDDADAFLIDWPIANNCYSGAMALFTEEATISNILYPI